MDEQPTLVTQSRGDLVRNLAALICLTASGSLVADFTHRMIAADPDSVGIASIVVQITAAVAASTAFTQSGMALIEASLSHAGTGHSRTTFRLKLAIILLVVAVPLWLFMPSLLAKYYFTRGHYLENQGVYAEAIRYYRRAIALDPTPQYFYVNAGVMLEQFYRYDDAQEQYRKAIVANLNDPIPYNDLGRVLLLDDKPVTALRVLEDGLSKPSSDPLVKAGLLKNKAWAEWLMGFSQAAIEDAKQSQAEQKKTENPRAAAATCLLAKMYGKLGNGEAARKEWQLFKVEAAGSTSDQPVIEPDCRLSAEVANVQN